MPYPPYDFYALRSIPDDHHAGYRAGDGMYADAVENLGLTVGVDVEPARDNVVERPADDAQRPAWFTYVSTQDTGKSREELENMSRDELIALVAEPEPEEKAKPKSTSRRSAASTTDATTETGA